MDFPSKNIDLLRKLEWQKALNDYEMDEVEYAIDKSAILYPWPPSIAEFVVLSKEFREKKRESERESQHKVMKLEKKLTDSERTIFQQNIAKLRKIVEY